MTRTKLLRASRIILALAVSLFSTNVLPTATAYATQPVEQVCTGLDSGKIDTVGNPTSVTVTAPAGQLIDSYCVKAGSANQGNGPEYVNVVPPAASVTFSHSSNKAVSHYSVSYTSIPDVCPNIAGVQAVVPAGMIVDANGNCVTPPVDVCPNIPDVQLAIPAGMVFDAQGNCVIPPPVDVCPNLADVQLTVPAGYVQDHAGNCVIDVCPNLDNIQLVVPDGYVTDAQGNCVIDMCPNLADIQLTVPQGMEINNDGHCVNKKVTICHRTNAAKNPYVQITVDENAVDGVAGNSGNQPDHYGEHTGPVFNPAIHGNGDDWGDIIPPVAPHHSGLNWVEGQTIYNNGCKPAVSPDAPEFYDVCGEELDFIYLPQKNGVVYRVNGVIVTDTYVSPTTTDVTVTAEPDEGYTFPAGTTTEWTGSFTNENCLTITKTALPLTDTNGDGKIGVGDIVTWEITVTNNGETEVDNFRVEVMDTDATLENDGVIDFLAAGESVTIKAYTTITAAHIGATCSVRNTATYGAWHAYLAERLSVLTDDHQQPSYDFTGSASAETQFACPTGQVLGDTTETPKVLATSTTKLPATLPATGGTSTPNPLLILVAALVAYGATYFLQGRRQTQRA